MHVRYTLQRVSEITVSLGDFCVWAMGGTGTVAWDAIMGFARDTAWNPVHNLAGWIALGDGRGDLKQGLRLFICCVVTHKKIKADHAVSVQTGAGFCLIPGSMPLALL